ncbi:MAG: isocitrate dehydrogenase kinase/phosphatase [Candidatus Azotimanducaceae bacterium]|jgi:isocitrate dehydrogenase kinase/phosphatase
MPRDALLVSERLKMEIPLLRDPQSILLETVPLVFYRNRVGYLVGRLVVDGQLFPLTLALCVNETGVFVDAVLWGEPCLSIIFSFARCYFMVETDEPSQLVDYLRLRAGMQHRKPGSTSETFDVFPEVFARFLFPDNKT